MESREYLSKEALNALAVEAKIDKDASLRLWWEVERFADKMTNKYRFHDNSVLSLDDYKQLAWIGFNKAVGYFTLEKGHSFLTYLAYCIRGTIWREYTQLCGKSSGTISLDKPRYGDSGEEIDALGDILPDEAAEKAFDTLLIEDIAQAILALVPSLPTLLQSRIIYECIYGGRTLRSLAEESGVSCSYIETQQYRAINWMRSQPTIRDIQKEFFAESRAAKRESQLDAYRTKGVAGFKSSFTSIVEEIALNAINF